MFRYTKKISIEYLDKELSAISQNLKSLVLPKGFLDFVLYTIAELFANVKEHSKTGVSVHIKVPVKAIDMYKFVE